MIFLCGGGFGCGVRWWTGVILPLEKIVSSAGRSVLD